MAFTEIEQWQNQKCLNWFLSAHRPPEHIRPQLDYCYQIDGHTVDLQEVRPDWKDKNTIRTTSFARVRFVRSASEWRLYWKRANGKWQSYEPHPTHRSLASALGIVHDDAYCCFFG